MNIKHFLSAWCCVFLFSCESSFLDDQKTSPSDGSILFSTELINSTADKPNDSVVHFESNLDLRVADFKRISKSDGSTTRATRLNKSNLANFGVVGFYTQGSSYQENEIAPNFMYDTKVSKLESKWVYSPVKYFPNNEQDKVSFFAYAPHSEGNNCISLSSNSHPGTPVINYIMPESVEEQVDLLVSPAVLDRKREDGAIKFSFRHALSCVSFSIKGHGEKVKSIGLKGISTTGTLSMDATTGITWGNLSSQSPNLYHAGINYEEDESYVLATTQGKQAEELISTDGYLMIIPQLITSETIVVVTYENDATQELALSGKLSAFKAGKSYNFKINTFCEKVPEVRESANCYIVNPAEGVVTIPLDYVNKFWGRGGDGAIATHMGMETRSPNPEDLSYVVSENMITDTNYSVELLWSDVNIDFNVDKKYADKFTISGCNKTGNAMICVKNPAGRILWSWHIWMTDFNPMENTFELADGVVYMDRNLGATSTEQDNINTLGLYYQLGRKDPFLGAKSFDDNTLKKPLYGEITSDKAECLLDYIYHPNVIHFAGGNGALLTKGHLSGIYSSNKWGGNKSTSSIDALKCKKTIYDPCPAGWRIPWGVACARFNANLVTLNSHGAVYKTIYFPFAGCIPPNRLAVDQMNLRGEYPIAYNAYDNKNQTLSFNIYDKYMYGDFNQEFLLPVRAVRDI